MLPRAALLLVCTTDASSWFASKKEKQPKTKPNILVLLADDHSAEALGYRGKARLSPLIQKLNVTPHLDQLAKEGITTEHAYTINALCTPARASILTGLYPNKHGATHLKPVSKGNASGIHDYIETYPEALQRNGYATALYGKYHLMSQPKGFDRYEVLLHQGSYEDPLLLNHTLSGKRWKARMKLWTRKRSDSGGARAAGHSSDIISQKAADAVASLPRPWLIEAHFKEPHEPFHYPPRYEGLTGAPVFDAARGVWTLRGFDVAEPPTLMQRPTRCRGIDVFANRSLANSTRRRTYAQLVADYLRTLKALDDGVGRVLRRVDDENTLVLYTSDHGYFLGEHGCYDKRLMLDEAIRVPFIIRLPAVLKPRRATFLARSVDVAPTLLGFAGLLGKRAFDGVSLVKALADKKTTTGNTLYYRYYDEAMKARTTPPAPPSHVGIRTDHWKLILFDGLRCTPGFRTSGDPIFALYDLVNDPREATDVYASTSTKVVSKLERELRAAMALYGGESHVKAGAHLPPDCLQLVCARVPFRRHRRDYPSSTPSTRGVYTASTPSTRPLTHSQDFGTPDFVECLRTTPCETPVMIAADSAKARRERIAAARMKSLARVRSRSQPAVPASVAAKHPAAAYLPRGEALAHIRAAAEAVARKHAGRGGGWRPNS